MKQKHRQVHGLGDTGRVSSKEYSTIGLGFVRQRNGRGEKEVMVSKPVAPITNEGGCGCTSDGESMATSDCREYLGDQPVRLERNLTNLSIEEPTGHYDLVDKITEMGTPVLCIEQLKSIGDISATYKPTP